MLYRALSIAFLVLTLIFGLLVVSNHVNGEILWTTSKIALIASAVVAGVIMSAFWKWAADLLDAVRD